MKNTQKFKVKAKLLNDGEIDNFWAMANVKTIRLGSIIHDLRKEGMEIDGDYLPGTKNYRYVLRGGPRKKVSYQMEIRDGRPIAVMVVE